MADVLASKILRAFGLMTMLGTLIACVSKNKEDRLSALSEAEKEKFAELEAEMDLGRNMAGRLLAHYGVVEDEGLAGYINQVGNYVASYGDFPERRYMFQVLDSEMINAFACPGGYILVTLGAIRLAQNEAELAMVLGHEAAHVGKQHMYETLKKMDATEMDKIAKESERKYGFDENMKARARPDPTMDSEAGKLIARYLAGASGVNVLQAARAGMSLILEKGLDKELEFEADREGVTYAVRAGYHPKAMLVFLDRLQKRKTKLNMQVLETTHPKIGERMAGIKTQLIALKANEIVGALGDKRFERMTKSLPKPSKKLKNVSFKLQ